MSIFSCSENTLKTILKGKKPIFYCFRYDTATLAENYSGAAHYGNEAGDNLGVLNGIGLRSVLLILVSSLCLVLASIGVCICLRKSNFLNNDYM